jgi:CheY-like chemotaxis protein
MTRPLRIAIADDEPLVRDYFQRMLTRFGHQVVATAANGRELVEMCDEQNPDLIITDIRMPELDGDTAVRQICSVRPTPFILLSACEECHTLIETTSVRQMQLTKPVKLHDLIEAIKCVAMSFENDDESS